MPTKTCPCGVKFEAKTPRAKWHSPACKVATRRRAARSGEAPAAPAAASAGPAAVSASGSGQAVVMPPMDAGLTKTLRDEFEAAGVLSTFPAQLALVVARKLDSIEASSVSSMSKELRALRAEALDGAATPAPSGPPEPEPTREPTALEKARLKREQLAAGDA